MDYHPFDRGAPFYAYYKKYRNRGCNYVENCIYRWRNSRHVSVNLSLIPTAEKGHEAFYIGSKQGIEER